MIAIETYDLNDSTSTATLDGKAYRLRMTWNDREGFWTIGVADDQGDIRITRIVRDYPLFIASPLARMPPGQFLCISQDGEPDRQSFVDGRAELLYAEAQEVADAVR